MRKESLQVEWKKQFAEKELLVQAKEYSFDYMEEMQGRDIYPSGKALAELSVFDEALPENTCNPKEVLSMLHTYGSPNTVSNTGGKYFGFVCGGDLPVSLAAKWLSDTWGQNSALFVLSPIAAKLEELCEKWLVDLLELPEGTAAGFVSGSSTAIICALAAARNELLRRQGWDVNQKGLFGAPPLRVILGEEAHSSVFKALSLLGIGKDCIEYVPVDDQGRMKASGLPELDERSLLIVQAGNVNSGAFDPMDQLCEAAGKAGAWVHVDGAFGLWAAASKEKQVLVKGCEKADSWSADAHKTLNAPYDCGIVFCKDRQALVSTMQATGSYIQYSESRDGMLYTPEMSRRARSIELWAILKHLGRKGVEELVDTLCENAVYFAEGLKKNGFIICNEIVFNQILVQCETEEKTLSTLKNIQAGGECWCGGARWKDKPVIRVSVCSWQTTRQDIDECIDVFTKCHGKEEN